MSTFRNPPKGHIYLVFELPPDAPMHYLTHVARSNKGNKVSVRGKVQPLRKTKGAHRLVVYCAGVQPVAQHIQGYVRALQEAFERTTNSLNRALLPLAGQRLNEETKVQARALLQDWAARQASACSIQVERDGDRLQVLVNPNLQTQPQSNSQESTMTKEFCRSCGTKPPGEPAIGEAPPTDRCPACGVPDPYKHPRPSADSAAPANRSTPGAQIDPHPAG
jgi:hypothetical protein